MFFILKGIVRFYVLGEEFDLIFGFLFENEFVIVYDLFLI